MGTKKRNKLLTNIPPDDTLNYIDYEVKWPKQKKKKQNYRYH